MGAVSQTTYINVELGAKFNFLCHKQAYMHTKTFFSKSVLWTLGGWQCQMCGCDQDRESMNYITQSMIRDLQTGHALNWPKSEHGP